MILKMLISIALIPFVYLMIATILTLLPFNKSLPEQSIDLDVLINPSQVNAGNLEGEYYLARDGSKLFYRYAPGNTKKVLILLHGSGSEGRYLVPLAEKISATAGISVIVPDLRGHGRSALSKMGDINYLEQYVHDLEDLNIYLREKYSDSTLILGGHSSGAGLAIKYGGEKYLPFDGYLLLAPYLGYNSPTVKPNSGGWVQVATKRYIGLTMFNRTGIKIFNVLPVIYFNRHEEWNDSLQAESYSYRLNEAMAPQNYGENLQNNKSPILVLVGSEDDAFYPDEFEPIFSKYAPNSMVRIVEGSKHIDLPDSNLAFSIIIDWLD